MNQPDTSPLPYTLGESNLPPAFLTSSASSACAVTDWCVLQVGHIGPCACTFGEG